MSVNDNLFVGSARSGENGGVNGQKPGDQKNGLEVSIQPYYMHSKGWHLIRAKDANIATKLAEAMTQACNNNNIGYDQDSHGSTTQLLKKYGSYDKIKELCEDDCSGLVRGCIYQASGIDVGDFYTGNEVTRLNACNLFDVYYTVDDNTYLNDGDILVTKTTGHTVIVTSGRPRVNKTKKTLTPLTDTNIRKDHSLNASIVTVAKKGTVLDILDEYKDGTRTWAKVEKGWMSEVYCKVTEVTDVKPITQTKIGKTAVVTTDLWVRDIPSLNGGKKGVAIKGSKYEILDVKNDGTRDWYKISRGFISGAYCNIE